MGPGDEKDTLESELPIQQQSAPPPQLPSYDGGGGMQMWMWLAFLAAFLTLIWGIGSEYTGYLQTKAEAKPFLQVTNRQISLFLWQNPEFMRVNVSSKSGYLPGFEYINKFTMNPQMADQYAIAPPEVLFRYHTWNRLLKGEFTPRPIHVTEFVEFLENDEAWQPENWPEAPEDYREMVKSLDPTSKEDMQKMPESTLPKDVRIAFQGWKNFQFEGENINAMRATYKQMAEFIKKHPHYARSYWRNISDRGQQQYLKELNQATDESDEVIPPDQLTPWLKVALYNFRMAEANK